MIKMGSKYKEPLWFYAGCGVLSGELKEPFSSLDLKKFCEKYGLSYSDATFNFYPQKHSINYGIPGFVRVFIADKKLYENFEDAKSREIDTRKNYRLDRETFYKELKRLGKRVKSPRDFP